MERTILHEIAENKRKEVAEAKARTPLADLRRHLADAPPVRDFIGALKAPGTSLIRGMSLIAEVKKASPSAGVIRPDFDPVRIARIYEQSGAAAISVLTDEKYFQGGIEHLHAVKAAVSIPCLRKDFIIDTYQVVEARAAGADAVLLITGILSDEQLAELLGASHELGMCCLVESHTKEELERAVASGARLIGINNRDLRTFRTDISTTTRLSELVPRDRTLVSESGIRSRSDVAKLQAAGVSAILVGESLMRAADIAAAVRNLMGE